MEWEAGKLGAGLSSSKREREISPGRKRRWRAARDKRVRWRIRNERARELMIYQPHFPRMTRLRKMHLTTDCTVLLMLFTSAEVVTQYHRFTVIWSIILPSLTGAVDSFSNCEKEGRRTWRDEMEGRGGGERRGEEG